MNPSNNFINFLRNILMMLRELLYLFHFPKLIEELYYLWKRRRHNCTFPGLEFILVILIESDYVAYFTRTLHHYNSTVAKTTTNAKNGKLDYQMDFRHLYNTNYPTSLNYPHNYFTHNSSRFSPFWFVGGKAPGPP